MLCGKWKKRFSGEDLFSENFPCIFQKVSVYCVRACRVCGSDAISNTCRVMGSEGSAACGGRSDPSEWQRSIKSRESASPKILSGTATGKTYDNGIAYNTCRCDGIGRRSGLKIHRWRQRAGSSPATGTKKSLTPNGVGDFLCQWPVISNPSKCNSPGDCC